MDGWMDGWMDGVVLIRSLDGWMVFHCPLAVGPAPVAVGFLRLFFDIFWNFLIFLIFAILGPRAAFFGAIFF